VKPRVTGVLLASVLTVGILIGQAPKTRVAPTPATAAITVDYPLPGSVFPPEFPPPEVIWRDAGKTAGWWSIEVMFSDGAAPIRTTSRGERMRLGPVDPRCIGPTNALPQLTAEQADARTWRPDAATWAAMKRHSAAAPATIVIHGYRDANRRDAVSQGSVAMRTSADPVGAPIFYRDVPLMPSETEAGVIKPLAAAAVPLIAWRLRDTGETDSRLLMEGLHSCANCHSFSRDGKTLGMDVDGPRNDKGLYAVTAVAPTTSIRTEDIIAWSGFRGKLGSPLRVGFMSQVSPDGRYVTTTINDPGDPQSEYQRRKNPTDLILNYYVANFKDYRFLQVFYPTRGILEWYSRETGLLQPLPGADDARYVHTSAVWSPDGSYLVFSRAEARDAYPPSGGRAGYANDPAETQIRYDLYRIPFHEGKGGIAEPIAGASGNGMSNSFPKVSPDGRWIVYVQARNGQLMRPDSQLYIVPAAGGAARRMRCNTPLMNSWHSFSPNGRWLVFSSKARSPYTQMYLTHLDEDGNDSPAILIENATAANRAVNIPEFVNVPRGGLLRIEAPATEYYRIVDGASDLMTRKQFAAAAAEWKKALALQPDEASAHYNLGLSLFQSGQPVEAIEHYERAIQLSPEYPEAHNNLGSALSAAGRLDEAILHFQKAVDFDATRTSAQTNLGTTLAQKGRFAEAIPHFEIALQREPDNAETESSMGWALAMTGRLDEAMPHLERAVTAKPETSEYQLNLARILAAQSRFEEAIPHFEKAVGIAGGADAAMLDLLAGAYSEAGRFTDAAQTVRRAIAIAERQNNSQYVETLKARLAYYEAKL
jgi:tetratricopeptide (TPR) repeat protein